jgi:hypothetical protein
MGGVNYGFIEFKMGSSSCNVVEFYSNQHLILYREMILVLIWSMSCSVVMIASATNMKN